MAAPEAFAALVDAALVALAREAPADYARLAALIGAEGVRIAVDGPGFVVRFGARSHSLEPAPAPAAVDVRSGRAAVAALLDGALALHDAIEADRLRLQGEVDALLRFEQALGAFLEGAARAPSLPGLLATWRDAE